MYGTTRSVEQDDEARPRLVFETFGPAVRWAIEAGVPFDQARDVLVAAVVEAAGERWRDLGELAVGLGRTTRSVRMLQKNPDPCVERRGVNLLARAEEVVAEGACTASELSGNLPQLEGFDSGRVALAALLRTGRVRPVVDRRGITRYEAVGPARPTEATPAQVGGLAALTSHLRAAGRAVTQRLRGSEPGLQTRTVRATPAALAAAEADIAAFIEAKLTTLSARAGDGCREYQVYLGHAAAPGDVGSDEGLSDLADPVQPLAQPVVQRGVEGARR
ncbi:MAG: hypothetical protein R3F60_12275 [bacterium]